MTAVVDTIIFEDGRVIGADESHLVDYINAIAGAVKALVQNLRDAASNGRDVDDVLRHRRDETDPFCGQGSGRSCECPDDEGSYVPFEVFR